MSRIRMSRTTMSLNVVGRCAVLAAAAAMPWAGAQTPAADAGAQPSVFAARALALALDVAPPLLHGAMEDAADGARVATSAAFGEPARSDQLERLRGGSDAVWSDPVWNNMELNGGVHGNSAQHVATGANTVTDGAFSNASGMSMVIQNSGANVLIQNATIINVQFK